MQKMQIAFFGQPFALLDGKRVIAPPKDIQEARNAIKAYEQLNH